MKFDHTQPQERVVKELTTMNTINTMKSLTLFYAGSIVAVRFPASTTRADFLAGICDALGVPVLSPLRFRDADGNIVLPSAELPDGLVLHVAIESGFAPAVEVARFSPAADGNPNDNPNNPNGNPNDNPNKNTDNKSTTNWARWERLHDKVKCAGDGRTFITEHKDSSRPFYALTNELPAMGLHYAVIDTWRIDSDRNEENAEMDNRRQCCVVVGAVDAALAALPNGHIGNGKVVGDEFLIPLMAVGLGPTKCYTNNTGGGDPMRVGILIDASAHELTIVDHDHPTKGAVRFVGIPNRVRIAVQSPKHLLKATIVECPVPTALVGYNAPLVVRPTAAESSTKKAKK